MTQAFHDPVDQMNAAVHDRDLRAALDRALDLSRRKRAEALSELPDAREARQIASDIRRYTLDNIKYYLTKFEGALEGSGVRVHWAVDAGEAVATVQGIARAASARRVVMSKSMVAEEIGLERGLVDLGLEVLQTDLGERILQLAGDRPSHIIAPCLHMSAGEIGRVFERTLDLPWTDNPEALSRAATADLRRGFLEADLGITGVNLAIADSGTLVVVENEGNVRMVTTLPRVVVSVMGIEKIVPDTPAALHLLDLLGRNATGQRWPGYVTWMSPGWPGEGPGPERHVVLVDNGRSRIHGAGPYRSLLWCIRCGACMNACPVYGRVGGHAYGHVYPGPIGAALAPLLSPGPGTAQLPAASTLCGACGDVCPVMIPLPGHLVRLRGDEAARGGFGGPPLLERLAFRIWGWFMGGRLRVRLSHWLHRVAERLVPGLMSRIADRLGWHGARVRPLPAAESFRVRWSRLAPPKEGDE
ncbi:MAG: lactate utilization protein B [Pseudomonadota bacterium]